MKSSKRQIEIWAGNTPRRVGTLAFQVEGNREVMSIAYEDSWLSSGFAISPDLPLVEGYAHFARKNGELTGFAAAITDAEPDGWGRRVIRRISRSEQAPAPKNSLEFLLAMDDEIRIGALRFAEEGVFLRTPTTLSAPPLLELEKVAGVLRAVESGRITPKELQFLSGMGTSLGGMRPKCSLRDTDGTLLIGKFPSMGDERNVIRGEMLAMRLAKLAGLDVAPTRICPAGKSIALAVGRFDRTSAGRIPYLSAGSLLGLGRQDDFSYQQLAEALNRTSSTPDADRLECWKRMAFNLLICNVDDHARNHGFLHAGSGKWRLAPAFDLNPFPDKERVLKAHLLEDGTPVDNIEEVFAAAPYFDIKEPQARAALAQIAETLGSWKHVARSREVGMNAQDIGDFEPAFDNGLIRKAAELAKAT